VLNVFVNYTPLIHDIDDLTGEANPSAVHPSPITWIPIYMIQHHSSSISRGLPVNIGVSMQASAELRISIQPADHFMGRLLWIDEYKPMYLPVFGPVEF
jgi:hypothetical protein